MEINTRTEGPYTVIALSGEVDLHWSPKLREQLLASIGDKQHVLVDLSQVSYIDSSGVASLVEGFQLAKNNRLRFGLVGVSKSAMQVLQLARLDKVFAIHDTVADRIAADEAGS
jgi:anti-sigma B factor antagonist